MKRVGVLGYGHIGKFLITELEKLPDVKVVRVWNRTPHEAEKVLPLDAIDAEHLGDIDLVIEVAHPATVKKYAAIILEHADLFIGSPTCLADAELFDSMKKIIEANPKRGLFITAGAFWGGNDVQKMADTGQLKTVDKILKQTLQSLTITQTKHPNAFKLESPLKEVNEKAKLNKDIPTVIYEGSLRELCPLAPNNVNTMAAGAVAAHNLGFDGVKARLVADAANLEWHVAEIEAVGTDGFNVRAVRRNPTKPGAVTGKITFYSFLASIQEALQKPPGMHLC